MQTQDVIETKQLRICDKNGDLRAILSTSPTDGMPYLNLYSENDSPPRLSLTLDPDGSPAVCLYRETKGVLSIGLSDTGAGISIHDIRGRPRAIIRVPNEGEPHIELYAEDGATSWSSD